MHAMQPNEPDRLVAILGPTPNAAILRHPRLFSHAVIALASSEFIPHADV
jgi:hypothetical protein